MAEKLPGPAYRIETPHLVIRCWEIEDAPLLKAAIDASLEHIRPWMPFVAYEPQPLQSKVDLIRTWHSRFDSNTDYVYGIFTPDELQAIGSSGLHTRLGPQAREIGYWIHTAFTHRGYATETTAALTKVAFELSGVERVEIHCDIHNVYSAAIPRRLGFTLINTSCRNVSTPHGEPHDTMVWTLFMHEYARTPAAALELKAFNAVGQQLL